MNSLRSVSTYPETSRTKPHTGSSENTALSAGNKDFYQYNGKYHPSKLGGNAAINDRVTMVRKQSNDLYQ